MIERYPEDELVIMTKEAELSKAEKLARAYVAVAQPAVNRAEELDALPVGSVIADLYDDRGDAPVVLCKALNRDWAALTTGTQNGRQWWTSAEIAHVARRLRVLHRPEVDA
ncbi:hypothetical protein ACLQ8T_06115 [Glutamicibacter sp. FR1]|uniref:hypothetical protein n=1 Tax=Glutamicibacter sp. FR1 TaxID=3393744 RepID=UPI0039B0CECF